MAEMSDPIGILTPEYPLPGQLRVLASDCFGGAKLR